MYVDNQKARQMAEEFGKTGGNFCFSHTIRKIERFILKTLGKHYHIITEFGDVGKSRTTFFNNCCEIWLPDTLEVGDRKILRLVLAHELGHLVYNINLLFSPEILYGRKSTDEEEVYCWEFAYYLVNVKSREYNNNDNTKHFIYTNEELKNTFRVTIQKKVNENVYKLLQKSLNIL